jgi:hypothetical protein
VSRLSKVYEMDSDTLEARASELTLSGLSEDAGEPFMYGRRSLIPVEEAIKPLEAAKAVNPDPAFNQAMSYLNALP